ncbi:MAG TPA: arginyltransferase [Desulfomonilaceae bacterium]|nr:arginyltransferase [Desulfomonilaceae bacterium]
MKPGRKHGIPADDPAHSELNATNARICADDLISCSVMPDAVDSLFYGTIPLDFLIRSAIHPCPYLPGMEAREEVFKATDFPPELYHDFMDVGFRRAGLLFYRTACPSCSECRPIRVPVGDFQPSKSQRRVLRKSRDIDVRVGRPRYSREKLTLYTDYLDWQHSRSHEDPSSLRDWLYTTCINTVEFEYRLARRLVAVGIADLCSRSLSSVYVFYDPDYASRSLGTFSALQEILFCRDHRIPHYYLGFLVADCPSMSYKTRFRPHERLCRSLKWARSE